MRTSTDTRPLETRHVLHCGVIANGIDDEAVLVQCQPQPRLRAIAAGLRRWQFRRALLAEIRLLVSCLKYSRPTASPREGSQHSDRNAQFEHINREVRRFQRHGQPAISVDAKNKELVGDFNRRGREWRRHGEAEEVRVKDFEDKRLGKVVPEGVYDLRRNEGWVSVGIDHDTAEFVGESIRRWGQCMGSRVYLHAKELLITADAGGSSG